MTEMTYRPLGDSGLMVSAVGIGCNAFGRRRRPRRGARHPRRRPRRRRHPPRHRRHLRRPAGRSEELLGEALAGQRDEFVLATKFGMDMQGANGRRPRRARLAALRPARRRGQPAPAAHRPHRPLPAARARRRHADRGDAVGAHRPGPRGQGPLPRLLELRGLAGRRRRLDRAHAPGSSGSSACRTATRCSTARSRPRWCRPARSSGSACCRSSRSSTACSPASTAAASRAPAGSRAELDPSRAQWLEHAPTGTGSRRSRSTPRRATLGVLDVAIAGLAAQPAVALGDRRRHLGRPGAPANAAALRWEPTEADLRRARRRSPG